MSTRDYDLVVFMATGDVKCAMTTLLAESPCLTCAGRSRAAAVKLEALAQAGSKREVLVADCADDEALLVLAAHARPHLGGWPVLNARRAVMPRARSQDALRRHHGRGAAAERGGRTARARAAGVCIASFCGCAPCAVRARPLPRAGRPLAPG